MFISSVLELTLNTILEDFLGGFLIIDLRLQKHVTPRDRHEISGPNFEN